MMKVAIEVALALTLLPALLGFFGERLRPKARLVEKIRNKPRFDSSRWWVGVVTAKPVVTILLVAAGAALPYVSPRLERFRPIRPDRAATLLASPFSGRPTVPLTVEVEKSALMELLATDVRRLVVENVRATRKHERALARRIRSRDAASSTRSIALSGS